MLLFVIDSTGSQLALCRESCDMVDRVSDRCHSQFTSIKWNRSGAFWDYFNNFSCSSPETYIIPGLPHDTEMCIQADAFRECSARMCMKSCVAFFSKCSWYSWCLFYFLLWVNNSKYRYSVIFIRTVLKFLSLSSHHCIWDCWSLPHACWVFHYFHYCMYM